MAAGADQVSVGVVLFAVAASTLPSEVVATPHPLRDNPAATKKTAEAQRGKTPRDGRALHRREFGLQGEKQGDVSIVVTLATFSELETLGNRYRCGCSNGTDVLSNNEVTPLISRRGHLN